MTHLEKCPVCGSGRFEKEIDCADYFLTQEKFTIQRCEACGLLLTNPRPDLAQLGSYYDSEAYISHSNSHKGIVSKVYQQVRNYTLKQKYRMVSKYHSNGKILDIGCATGEFLRVFAQNNWDCTGIEPNEDARNAAAENYGLRVFPEDALGQLPEHSFDVITLWHVLEHVPFPDERMQQLKKLLKPDGVLFVAVPNCQAFDAQIYQAHWAAYDVPRHLFHFSQSTMGQLCEKVNMKVQDIRPMKFDAYYVSLLSEKYKNHRNGYLQAVWNGFRSNLWARNNHNNYSSLIFVVKHKIG